MRLILNIMRGGQKMWMDIAYSTLFRPHNKRISANLPGNLTKLIFSLKMYKLKNISSENFWSPAHLWFSGNLRIIRAFWLANANLVRIVWLAAMEKRTRPFNLDSIAETANRLQNLIEFSSNPRNDENAIDWI